MRGPHYKFHEPQLQDTSEASPQTDKWHRVNRVADRFEAKLHWEMLGPMLNIGVFLAEYHHRPSRPRRVR